jgi:Raf kinase inhibitor-like YbhB/YbcL family protein
VKQEIIMTRPLALSLLLCATSALAATPEPFQLSSNTIKPGATLTEQQVFNGFGCSGKNQSPALQWSNAPPGTRSFAITLYDPDAPTGSGWWHWVVYNLPATTMALAAGAGSMDGKLLPVGAMQGRTDFGATGFGGACPPSGSKPHHYVFTVYALKVERLEVSPDSTAALIGFMINANKLAAASFTALYSR